MNEKNLFDSYDFLEGLNLLTGNELKVYMGLMWDDTLTYLDIRMDCKTFRKAYKHLYELGLFNRHWKMYLVDVQTKKQLMQVNEDTND